MSLLSGLFLVSQSSQASTIYFDEFSGDDGGPLVGRVSDVNNGVADALWDGPTTVWPQDIQGNRAGLGADTHVSLDISSSGDFVQPERIQVSALMNMGTTSGPGVPSTIEPQRGIGLGFYEGILSVATNSDFRGLLLGTDGRLILARAGANGSPRAGFLAEIATGIDTTIDHTLSFEINTITGDISNIILDGQAQPDVETDIFNTNVNRVGFFASSEAGGTRATFDNFTVTDAAGPSTDPAITSITRVDPSTFELSITGAAGTEFVVAASESLDFDNGSILNSLTQESVDDPGQVNEAGDIVTTDENGKATFRIASESAKNFVRLQVPIGVVR